jgi:hypothetical protein
VDYVLIEEDKIKDFQEDPEFFASRFPVVYRTPNYTLLKISGAGSSERIASLQRDD